MGYTNNYEVLDAREFGLPQARERVFTISVLGGEKFQFDELIRTPMRSIDEFLEKNEEVPEVYGMEVLTWQARIKKNVTLKQLEQMTGISKTTLNTIENGLTSPTLRQLEAIAIALDTKISALYDSEYK